MWHLRRDPFFGGPFFDFEILAPSQKVLPPGTFPSHTTVKATIKRSNTVNPHELFLNTGVPDSGGGVWGWNLPPPHIWEFSKTCLDGMGNLSRQFFWWLSFKDSPSPLEFCCPLVAFNSAIKQSNTVHPHGLFLVLNTGKALWQCTKLAPVCRSKPTRIAKDRSEILKTGL